MLLHIRDEILNRAVQPPTLGCQIIGGVDLQAGGTWMGVDVQSRRFAALTNVRRKLAHPQQPASRGQLVMKYLAGETNLNNAIVGDSQCGFVAKLG